MDTILEAFRLWFLDTFGTPGSWTFYLSVAMMWLVALLSLIGMVVVVGEWFFKVGVWVYNVFRKVVSWFNVQKTKES